jgi:hypothetical protein
MNLKILFLLTRKRRFSVYVFGRATKDADVLRVGSVLESGLEVQGMLVPYLEPRTEIGDRVGQEE